MSEEPAATTAAPAGWMARFGYRNIAYVAVVLIVIAGGIALEASGPRGPDSGGGIMSAMLIWALGSLAFLLVNAVLAVVAFARDRPARIPATACALPLGIIFAMLLLEELMDAAGLM